MDTSRTIYVHHTATRPKKRSKEGMDQVGRNFQPPLAMSGSTPKSYFEFLMLTLHERPRLDTWLNWLRN